MRALILVAALAAALALAACGDDAAPERSAAPASEQDGGDLGGQARTVDLAREAEVQTPRGEVAWTARAVTLEPGEELRHRHAFSTLHAHAGGHALTAVDGRTTLAEGEGATVPADARHVHATAGDEPSVFWEILLGPPGAELPGTSSEIVFQSEPLEGIPANAALRFILVELPPGAQTSVHTHPGPEFIYGLSGEFTYENAIEGERRFGPGDQAGIPPETAVQKRNDTRGDASFLSWFLVDPREPFAPGAEFTD